MTEWRLLNTGANDAFTNMAIDEAIMRLCSRTGRPTVRFFSWKPSAVSIGYFQAISEEVDLRKCRELGVDVVRRLTGGGAVFHEYELTYSFACSEESGIVPKKILDSYSKICNALVGGLGKIGLEAKFVPLNDIIVNGRKISGNAQTRREKAVLQHGTLLMQVDVDRMFELLLVPNEKLKGKLIEDVKQRVTSVEKELGRRIPSSRLAEALKEGFEENFDITLREGKLSKEEGALARKIKEERFSQHSWNFMR